MNGHPSDLITVKCIDSCLEIPKSELQKIPYFKTYLDNINDDINSIYVSVFKKSIIIARYIVNSLDTNVYDNYKLYNDDLQLLLVDLYNNLSDNSNPTNDLVIYNDIDENILYKIIRNSIKNNNYLNHDIDIILFGNNKNLYVNDETKCSFNPDSNSFVKCIKFNNISFNVISYILSHCYQCNGYKLIAGNHYSINELLYDEKPCKCNNTVAHTKSINNKWYKIKITNISLIDIL